MLTFKATKLTKDTEDFEREDHMTQVSQKARKEGSQERWPLNLRIEFRGNWRHWQEQFQKRGQK